MLDAGETNHRSIWTPKQARIGTVTVTYSRKTTEERSQNAEKVLSGSRTKRGSGASSYTDSCLRHTREY